jgi:hypothetical protein
LSWQYGTIIVHALEFTKWATWTKFQHRAPRPATHSQQWKGKQRRRKEPQVSSELSHTPTDHVFCWTEFYCKVNSSTKYNEYLLVQLLIYVPATHSQQWKGKQRRRKEPHVSSELSHTPTPVFCWTEFYCKVNSSTKYNECLLVQLLIYVQDYNRACLPLQLSAL